MGWLRMQRLSRSRIEGGSDGLVERSDNLDNAIGFGFGEDAIESFGIEIRERRLIEKARIHDALLGQVVDDGSDEVDWLALKMLASRILGKGSFGGSPIGSD
jgi:hypothetical protein